MRLAIAVGRSDLDDPKTTDDVLDHVDTALASIHPHLALLSAPFHPELFGHIWRPPECADKTYTRFVPVVVCGLTEVFKVQPAYSRR